MYSIYTTYILHIKIFQLAYQNILVSICIVYTQDILDITLRYPLKWNLTNLSRCKSFLFIMASTALQSRIAHTQFAGNAVISATSLPAAVIVCFLRCVLFETAARVGDECHEILKTTRGTCYLSCI